jgi:hypothetical protein
MLGVLATGITGLATSGNGGDIVAEGRAGTAAEFGSGCVVGAKIGSGCIVGVKVGKF